MKRLAAAAAAATAFATGAYALQGVKLALNLPQGSKYTYKSTIVQSNDMGGQSKAQAMTQTMTQVVQVVKRTGANHRIKTTITDVKSSGGGEQMASMHSQIQKSLKGSTIEADYASTGKVSNMKTGGTENAQMMKMMRSLDIGFMGMMYPGKAVAVGAIWNGSIDMKKILADIPGANMMKVTSGGTFPVRYKLAGVKNVGGKQMATIAVSVNGNMSLTMDMPNQGGQQGQKMDMKLALTSNGTIQVNTANGLPTYSTSNSTMKMNMMGMDMTQKITSTTSLQ